MRAETQSWRTLSESSPICFSALPSERLAHLGSYVSGPPIGTRRAVRATDGRVIHPLKPTGATACRTSPSIHSRPSIAWPLSWGRPRARQLTDHGVVAPASAWRAPIVPTRACACCALLRGSRSQLADGAGFFYTLALAALQLRGTSSPRHHRRRPELPARRADHAAPPRGSPTQPSRTRSSRILDTPPSPCARRPRDLMKSWASRTPAPFATSSKRHACEPRRAQQKGPGESATGCEHPLGVRGRQLHAEVVRVKFPSACRAPAQSVRRHPSSASAGRLARAAGRCVRGRCSWRARRAATR